MIRSLEVRDIEELRKIHARFYSKDFEFPDFLRNYICCFVVTDSNGRIISGGGVRLIAESVIVTDLSLSPKERVSALLKILDASEYICNSMKMTHLHAVTEDTKWGTCLARYGFQSRGNIYALKV